MAFISVIIVACTDTAPIPPPGTPTPRAITLTIEGLSGAPPATARPTLTAVTATPEGPDPAAVEFLAPECSDSAGDGYQCLGIVRNTGGDYYGTLMLRATLYDGSEHVETHALALEQRLLLPDGDAPYRMMLTSGARGPLVLEIGEIFPPADDLFMLETRDLSADARADGYDVSAVIVNDHAFALYDVRAVAVLYDDGRLTRFRVIEVGTISASAEVPLALRWYGVQPSRTLSVTLAVTGNKNPAK